MSITTFCRGTQSPVKYLRWRFKPLIIFAQSFILDYADASLLLNIFYYWNQIDIYIAFPFSSLSAGIITLLKRWCITCLKFFVSWCAFSSIQRSLQTWALNLSSSINNYPYHLLYNTHLWRQSSHPSILKTPRVLSIKVNLFGCIRNKYVKFAQLIIFCSYYHCEKYRNSSWFPGVKILRKGTVSA